MDLPTKNGRLHSKRALITGAGSGLGEAMARLFAAHGAAVLCVDRNPEANAVVAASIRDTGGNAFTSIGDVANSSDVNRIGSEADQLLGGIDILVNNAGVILSRETVLNTNEHDWDESLRVNLKSVFLMSQMAIPRMIRQGGGSIINMASITGLVGTPVRPAYSASKAGVAILSRQMAVDFGKHNIRVNALAPSFIVTNINRAMIEKMKEDPASRQKTLEAHPLPWLGEPEDVAWAALYLASDEARWITGVILPVDGGFTAR